MLAKAGGAAAAAAALVSDALDKLGSCPLGSIMTLRLEEREGALGALGISTLDPVRFRWDKHDGGVGGGRLELRLLSSLRY